MVVHISLRHAELECEVKVSQTYGPKNDTYCGLLLCE